MILRLVLRISREASDQHEPWIESCDSASAGGDGPPCRPPRRTATGDRRGLDAQLGNWAVVDGRAPEPARAEALHVAMWMSRMLASRLVGGIAERKTTP